MIWLGISILLGSRIAIDIKKFKTNISATDIFVFLTAFWFGGEAAILLASAEAFSTSLRFSKFFKVRLFNVAVMACSTSAMVWATRLLFGPTENVIRNYADSYKFILVMLTMVVAQYVINVGLITGVTAIRKQRSYFKIWREYYQWVFIVLFAAVSCASVTAILVQLMGVYALVIVSPIIATVYFTYTTYNKNIEASVTQANQSQQHILELQQSEERFRSAFNFAPIGMGLVAPDGRWMKVNNSLCEILGYPETELLKLNLSDLIHPLDALQSLAQIGRLVQGKIQTFKSEIRFYNKSGDEVWTIIGISRTYDTESKDISMVVQIQDISDRKQAEAQLLHDAFHDGLTGLSNRTLLLDHLQGAMERAEATSRSFALFFIDLDRFKLINDSLGHSFGDKVLIEVGERLKSCVRPTDTVARLGGDEFIVLTENLKHSEHAARTAQEIQKSISQPIMLANHESFPTSSIGIAVYNRNYSAPEEMLRDADTAMYHAKAAGKSQYAFFDREMHENILKTLQLETALRYAIERNEFFVVYQPIISLETSGLTGFEALIRWKHPERGIVSPLEFISIAEDSGFIIKLGKWILDQACRQVKKWQTELNIAEKLTISVNVSSKQLIDENFVEDVLQVLKDARLAPTQLKLEITESVVMESIETTKNILEKLREAGIRLSIDDFGTGYSSLSYLHRLPINTLKIDRSFINNMENGNENTEIVRTIIMLAKSLGMSVTAEGIETAEQFSQLRALGCDYGQGYFFAKPLETESAGEMISRSFCINDTAATGSDLTESEIQTFNDVPYKM